MRRILLTDDEPAVLEAVVRNLRRHRPAWRIEHAHSGSEALALADRNRYDAYVLDCRMPGMSGIEAATTLRRRYDHASCVMLTGHADLKLAMQAVNEARVVRFLTKPCTSETLIDAIEAAIGQHDRVRAIPGGSERATADTALSRLALERLPFAAFRLSLEGRLAESNDQGARLLADGDVLTIDAIGNLRTTDATPRDGFEAARRRVAALGGTSIVRLLHHGDGSELTGALFRLDAAPGIDIPQAGIALFVTEPARHILPDPGALAAFFALTPSEARLTHALLRGLSIQEASVDVGITVNSARTYLRHIFAKLAISRQSELIRAVLTSPIMFLGTIDVAGATDQARGA